MKEPVVILGAGLTGLSTAYHLKRDYQIFEKEDEAGGLCRSHIVNGFSFDYTGHLLFLKDPGIKKLVFDLLGNNIKCHSRKSWVYLKDQLIPFPFQANFGLLPASIAKECLGDFIFARGYNKNKDANNFSSWLNSRFGKGLTKYFLRPYNEKMWRVPLSRITLDWVEKFIPQPELDDVVEGVLGKKKDKYGYNAEFWYPEKGGIFSLPRALKNRVKNLHLNEEAVEISLKKKTVRFRSKKEISYSNIVSTMPLPELIKIIKDIPAEIKTKSKGLSCCSVFNINLGLNIQLDPNIHWIYFPEKKYPFYRYGVISNFSGNAAPAGKSSIYIEISYSSGKKINKKHVLEDTIKRLIELKVISDKNDINTIKTLDIKYAYVIYNSARKNYLRDILEYLEKQGIYSRGRYGSFDYSSMNDALIAGTDIAEKLNAE
ncbi:MAG: FAD-dependent oxidoreductase [bacterium]|nr:FAD-dependent oxidoreductase [bacterium]